MKIIAAFAALLGLGLQPLGAWTRPGHERVASQALEDLPTTVHDWFEGQEPLVLKHSNDPDLWKRDPRERLRHFIQVETYGGAHRVPLDPEWARLLLGDLGFQASGQLPWVVRDRVRQLGLAFRSGDRKQVAIETAVLSHYVGDLHVPLHTALLGDGPREDGLHRRWESLVEHLTIKPLFRFAIPDPGILDAPWKWLKDTHGKLEAIFQDDRLAGASFDYWETFNRLQGAVVADQLSLAAQHTAQLVFHAWEQAGHPSVPRGDESRWRTDLEETPDPGESNP
jgi:hypothetical protein